MLQVISRQIRTLLLVCFAIIFLTYLGMGSRSLNPGEVIPAAWQNTLAYIANLFKGNLGTFTTFTRQTNVTEILWQAYFNSTALLGIAITTAGFLGLLLGTALALIKNKTLRFSILSLTTLGISVPSFLAVVLLQQIGLQFNVALGKRIVSMAGFAWSFEKMFFPILILTARPLAYITRIVYTALTQILTEDYIRTAYAKGLSSLRVFIIHAFRNLGIPFLSALAVSFRFSISTLILVEFLFAWPGMGVNLFSAINERHTVLVVGIVLLIGLTIQTINFLLDLSYRFIDPRIQDEA